MISIVLLGVGGTFLVSGSRVKQHVMADFSTTPLENEEMINKWLRFYDMNPPLVAVGTFVTNDPVINDKHLGRIVLIIA